MICTSIFVANFFCKQNVDELKLVMVKWLTLFPWKKMYYFLLEGVGGLLSTPAPLTRALVELEKIQRQFWKALKNEGGYLCNQNTQKCR